MTIDMTEDHRVASATERARIVRTGQPLKDGEVRLSGMILCPVFGSSVLFFSFTTDGGGEIK
jgi:protein phosphatase